MPSSTFSSSLSPPRPSTPLLHEYNQHRQSLSSLGKEYAGDDPLPVNAAGSPSPTPRPIPTYSAAEETRPPLEEMLVGEDEVEGGSGARKVEEVQEVWGPKSQWLLFIGIGLSAYIYSLDGLTTWQYLQYATSAVLEHSLSGTIGTAQAIIIAVGKPLMAKLADVAETFIIVTVLYVIGYITIATANDIQQIAAGEIFYAFGYTGLQMLQLIVIADMTNLRWRGLVTGMISAPFIINNFVSAEIAQRVLPNWRWGYAMFAILVPLSLSPMIVALLWAQWKLRRIRRSRILRPQMKRKWSKAAYDAASDMDFVGLLLIASSLGLLLLPLGLLRKESVAHWYNPSLFGMIALGLLLIPCFLYYEARYPSKPVVPMRWLQRGPILGACIIGFLDFASFYLQYTYLYSYVYVTREWSYRELTYFTATQSLVMTIFGIFGGALMWATHRFKYMLLLGLLIRLAGCLSMLRARSPTGTAVELIMCQVLQGIGGGFAAIAIQVSAQASVAHVDVATVTALVLLISEVGNSVGSATATGIWSIAMPVELGKHLPPLDGESGGRNETLVKELFGSIERIVAYPVGGPIRDGAIAAYHNVMYKLVLVASAIALLPPVVCLLLTKDIHLGRAQNAHDGKDLAGRSPEARRRQRTSEIVSDYHSNGVESPLLSPHPEVFEDDYESGHGEASSSRDRAVSEVSRDGSPTFPNPLGSRDVRDSTEGDAVWGSEADVERRGLLDTPPTIRYWEGLVPTGGTPRRSRNEDRRSAADLHGTGTLS